MMFSMNEALIRRASAIIMAIACVVGVGAMSTGMTDPVDRRLEALRDVLLSRRASGSTVIVQIDTKSLTEMQAWPWPRSTHGRMVERLHGYGARRIVFDVDFKSPAKDPSEDRAFAASIARADGSVVLPGVLENADGHDGPRTESLPSAPLRRNVSIGSIWVPIDPDMMVRRVPYGVMIGGAVRPSLSSYLADRTTTSEEPMPIDWSIDPESIPKVSYSDVMAGRIPASFFAGRNVLIGATSATMGDLITVPNHGRIPGLYVQAVGSETLRRGVPADVGPWPALLTAMAAVMLALRLSRSRDRLLVLVVTGVSFGILPLALEHWTSILTPIAPALAIIGTAFAAEAAAGVAIAYFHRVTRSSITGLPNESAMRMSRPAAGVTVAVSLRNHVETAALLGPAGQAELLLEVHRRLRIAAGPTTIYQVDDHSFAWRAHGDVKDIGETVEGMHALFLGGIVSGGRKIDVTLSVGLHEDGECDVPASIAAAMVAANRAHQRGIPWELYVSDDDEANWRLSLLSELDHAIDEGHLWVSYQGKYDVAAGKVVGAEALVRWTHPERGFIRPDHFIPIVEESGRIDRLTLFVLETAIRDFSGLDDSVTVAVNISTRMLGRGQLHEPVRQMLERHGMNPARLTLEVTESASMTDARGIDDLNQLRDLGIKISIDDYGTGQSTLSYLKTLPATELKIDRSFVSLILTNRSDATVVDSTIKLAHALSMVVVAEGVETKEILAALKGMDCDVIQGYHIGKPAPLADFVEAHPEVKAIGPKASHARLCA